MISRVSRGWGYQADPATPACGGAKPAPLETAGTQVLALPQICGTARCGTSARGRCRHDPESTPHNIISHEHMHVPRTRLGHGEEATCYRHVVTCLGDDVSGLHNSD